MTIWKDLIASKKIISVWITRCMDYVLFDGIPCSELKAFPAYFDTSGDNPPLIDLFSLSSIGISNLEIFVSKCAIRSFCFLNSSVSDLHSDSVGRFSKAKKFVLFFDQFFKLVYFFNSHFPVDVVIKVFNYSGSSIVVNWEIQNEKHARRNDIKQRHYE